MKNQIYPVGYTVMPIIKTKKMYKVGETNKEEGSIVAYIPSKCYLVSSDKKITKSGQVVSSYGVVYPYVTGESVVENYYISNYPEYNSEGECVNSSKTEFLTDNFEDALKQSVINNNELLNSTSYSRGSMTSHLTSKENYKKLISTYMEVALFLEDRTSDIDVNITDYVETTDNKQILKNSIKK